MYANHDLETVFTYHKPKEDQLPRYEEIRNAGRHFAEVLIQCCPAGPDLSAAIRKVREAVMTANAAIALGEA